MARSLETLTSALLDAARAAGAEAADAIAVEGTSQSIDVRAGALEQAERSEGVDIGLRVLIGRRQACVSASDLAPDVMREMAERAVAMAREAPEDPGAGLADPSQLARDLDSTRLDLVDHGAEPAPADLQDAAARAEAAALAVSGVSQVQSASAAYGARQIHLAASNGFAAGWARTDHALSVVAITGEGTKMERDYYGDMRAHREDLMSAEEIGRIAAERTVARAGARRPKTGAYPVIYDERVAASLIGHLVGAINGAAVARGSSWAADLLGTQVLPEGMDLIEDPLRPRIGGSRLFDSEGLPKSRSAIVQDGVLQRYILDLATARKLGMESTANAGRGTGAPPSPSVSNLTLTQGTQTQADMLAEMGTGLLITSMIGSTISATTGDYSRGASGFWVENGEIAYPVNECTVAGNLKDMLRTIRPANDARTHLMRVVPSLLVEGLTLAGE
ncbi:MAG: TldD/PmbA family protein [Celeribacter sp.]|jgi:PmbA protein